MKWLKEAGDGSDSDDDSDGKESLATNHLSPNIQRNSKLYYDSFDLENF